MLQPKGKGQKKLKMAQRYDEADSILISALQKFIRRGELKGALAVAREFCLSYDRWSRLWRRLIIIATEDIGIAHTGCFSFLRSKKAEIEADETKREEITLKTVRTLVSAYKSRLTDNSYLCLVGELEARKWRLVEEFSIWKILTKEIKEEACIPFIVHGSNGYLCRPSPRL